jgi:hypothetical protein
MESLMLQPQQIMQYQFFNNSTAGEASWYFNPTGRKFQNTINSYKEGRVFMEENYARKAYLYPYWLTTDVAVTLSAGGTATVFMTVTDDMEFVGFNWMKTFISTGVEGDTEQGFSFQIIDPTTKRPLQNSPRVGGCQAGTAEFPFQTGGLIWNPRTTMQVILTNLITDQATEVFLTVHGVAKFRGAAPFAANAGVRPVERGPTQNSIRTAVR